MKILCIGHSSYDISFVVPEIVENTKYRINNKIECGGGPAGNAAYLLGKWQMDTTYVGMVGYDTYGTKIKKEFQDIGVNTTYLETDYENSTSLSMIMINEKTGSRTLFNLANKYSHPKKLKTEIPKPDVIFIDGHDYDASIEALKKWPNAISIIDAGRITDELLEQCAMVKYLVCSKGFAETVIKRKFDFNNPNEMAKIYLELKEKYKKSEVVITLEEHGALYQINNSIRIMPAIKVTPVDTTGCGDIFHGAFTYAIANGYDIEKAVKIANITAGLSTRKIGARLSIPELSEVLEYYESHK